MSRGRGMAAYRPPSVGSRAGGGSIVAVVLFVAYVLVPVVLFSELRALAITPPVAQTDLAIAGVVLAALGTAQYLLKPTRAFGPVSIVYALALLGYLDWLGARSPISFALQGATVTVGYHTLILIASIVPLLALLGGIAATLEDATEPGERVRVDFPRAVAWR